MGRSALQASVNERLAKWLDTYLEWLAQRGYSPATRRTYGYHLREFLSWVKQEGELKALAELTPERLARYWQWLFVRPHQPRPVAPSPRSTTALSAETRNGKLKALQSFFRFLLKRRVLLVDPSRELEYARVPQTLPRSILTISEVYRLLEAFELNTPAGCRDRAAVELLYATAMRRSELLELRLDDLRLREELVRVRGKGNKERVVPMGSQAAQVLRLYLKTVRPLWKGAATQTAVFLSARGTALQERSLREAIQAAARRAGVKKKVSFHTFRHSCATHLLARRADIRHIQALLGHADLTSTQRYTRVSVHHLRQMILRCHPRERLDD